MPETGRSSVRRFVQRLIRSVGDRHPCAIGASIFPADGLSAGALVERAIERSRRAAACGGTALDAGPGTDRDYDEIVVDPEVDLLAGLEEGRVVLRMIASLVSRIRPPEQTVDEALHLLLLLADADQGKIQVGGRVQGECDVPDAAAAMEQAKKENRTLSQEGPGPWLALGIPLENRMIGAAFVKRADGQPAFIEREKALLEALVRRIAPWLHLTVPSPGA